MAYATCTHCKVTFNTASSGGICPPCQRCGGVTAWLVPPTSTDDVETVDLSIVDETMVSHTPEFSMSSSVDVDGDTVADIDHHLSSPPSPTPPPAPRDSATRRLDSDAGIGSQDAANTEDDELDESTIGLFGQPVPPMPKLSSPTDQADVPSPVRSDSANPPTVMKPAARSRRGLPPWLAVLLSAAFGGVLAWWLTGNQ